VIGELGILGMQGCRDAAAAILLISSSHRQEGRCKGEQTKGV